MPKGESARKEYWLPHYSYGVQKYNLIWKQWLWIHILKHMYLPLASGKIENGRSVATGTHRKGRSCRAALEREGKNWSFAALSACSLLSVPLLLLCHPHELLVLLTDSPSSLYFWAFYVRVCLHWGIFFELKLWNPYPYWAFWFYDKYLAADEQRCHPVVLQTDPSVSIDLIPFPSSTVTPGTHQPRCPSRSRSPTPTVWRLEAAWKCALLWKREMEEPAAAPVRAGGCWHPLPLPQGPFGAAPACTFFWGFVQLNFRCLKRRISLLRLLHRPDSSLSKYSPASLSTFFPFFFSPSVLLL